jgi:hypothetical protein
MILAPERDFILTLLILIHQTMVKVLKANKVGCDNLLAYTGPSASFLRNSVYFHLLTASCVWYCC